MHAGIGLRQLPYWSTYCKPRLIIHVIISSKYFDLSISGIIGLNVITMALEFHMMPTVIRRSLSLADGGAVGGALNWQSRRFNPRQFHCHVATLGTVN